MPIQKSLWRRYFPALPSWPCPTCGKGTLKLKKNTFAKYETGTSRKTRSEEEWSPEWIVERFICVLECDNPLCGEISSLSGHVDFIEYFYYDHNDVPNTDYQERIWPLYISPAPHIFPIPLNCPALVRKSIIAGFELFWCDRDGCASKWRIALEHLLTDKGVPRFYKRVKGQPLRAVPLHKRIEVFRSANKDAADCLEAVKWLGNHASHAGADLKEDDIIQAAEILEHALNMVYPPGKSPLQTAKKINKKKGPLKK